VGMSLSSSFGVLSASAPSTIMTNDRLSGLNLGFDSSNDRHPRRLSLHSIMDIVGVITWLCDICGGVVNINQLMSTVPLQG
jgi:hypothetical protein